MTKNYKKSSFNLNIDKKMTLKLKKWKFQKSQDFKMTNSFIILSLFSKSEKRNDKKV